MKKQTYVSVEGTAALKWNESPACEGAGEKTRIIAFPGIRVESNPADRFEDKLSQTTSAAAPRLSLLLRLRRACASLFCYERLKGVEFDHVSRRGEIGAGATFAVIGLLIVLLGS